MIKVYGSTLCRYTRDLRLNLDKYNIEYEFHDINSSLQELKDFMHIRDKYSIFDRQKEVGGIGIPVIIDGDIVTNRWVKYLESKGITKVLSYFEECVDKNC